MSIAALVVGLLIVALGMIGLAAPESFLQLVQFIQTPPNIYVAAVVRIAFGIILVLAAPQSRAPVALRILGALMLVGGLVTPFMGVRVAEIILGWWAQGPGVVRAWAVGALVLGFLIVYATARKQRTA